MKQRALVAVLLIACAVLGTASCLMYVKQDRTPPVITMEEKKLSYKEGTSYEELLKGVSAKDNKDGDLSDQVFVDKIVPMEDGKAVVYYGVIDENKNIGTATRIVTYIAKKQNKNQIQKEQQETTTKVTKESETKPEQETIKESKPAQETTTEPESETEQETTADLSNPTGEKPVIALKQNSLTIAAGSSFDRMSVIENVADAKDDRNTLYRRISIHGDYSTYQPGSYTLEYYVTDMDGNTSDIQQFTLIVK